MGRKSHSKQNKKENGSKENNRNIQKRKELAALVDKLLRLTSVFQAASNYTKSWEHHLEISAILKEIVNIETPYNSKVKGSPRQTNIEKYLKWLSDNGAQFEGKQGRDDTFFAVALIIITLMNMITMGSMKFKYC